MNINLIRKRLQKISQSKKIFLLLLPGIVWIIFNHFFVPFQVGSELMHRPWLVVNGEIPYRDFEWIRNPLDIFLIASVFKLFGVYDLSLRLLVFVLYLVISLTVFFSIWRKSLVLAATAFYVYVVLLFPLFINTQIGEALVGLFVFLSFTTFWKYIDTKKERYIFLAGIFSGLSLVTKQTSIGVLFAIIFTFIVFYIRRGFVKKLILYSLGVVVPYFFLILYLIYHNALNDYFYYAIYFNLFIYRELAGRWGFNEGMKMLLLYASSIIPFAFITTPIITRQIKFLLIMMTIAMIPTLLPSFWSYRLSSALPLVSLISAVVFLFIFNAIKKNKKSHLVAFSVLSLFIFITFFSYFWKQYASFIKNYGVSYMPYIYDQTQQDVDTAKWLLKNTPSDVKIFNTASNTIMRLANRRHHNKYIDGLPWVYYPYDQTFKEITKVPPEVVVWDSNLTTNWPELREWKFVPYLHQNYTLKKSIKEIEIYYLNSN